MEIRKAVQWTRGLEEKDLQWKPLYPNNIKENGVSGYYCFLWLENEEGKWSGRKYTILFQEREKEIGLVDEGNVELYILFEKTYNDMTKPVYYPDLSKPPAENTENVLNSYDVNSYGAFVRAYKHISDAQKRALLQFKMVYAYALTHVLSEE